MNIILPRGSMWCAWLWLLTATTGAATEFKLATVAPEGSQWMEDMRRAASEIKERTDGRAVLKFYSGGVMGNDKKVLRKIRIGQLHGGAFTASGLYDRYPDIAIYGLPLLFRSQAEVDYVRERVDPILSAGLDAAGFVSFGFAGGGFAKLMGGAPVRRLDDLRGRKVWVPEGDVLSYEAMEALSLSPVVLPITDVLTGLQTGLIDYFATPPVGAVVLQWYTKVKYITDLPLAYSLGVMVIEKRKFSRLSEADQDVFRTVMTRIYAGFEQRGRDDNRNAEAALVANGLQLIAPDSVQVPEWWRLTTLANNRMGEKRMISPELLAQIQAHLEDYRASATDQRSTANAP